MAITTIALHVEPDTLGAVDASIALPLALAEAHSAHVAALVFAASLYHAEPAGGDAGMPEAEQAAREDGVVLHVRSALEARGLRFDVRGRSSFAYGVGEVLADQMRVSDLGVMSFGSGADMGKRWVATGGIFSSGRPMLLVPPSQTAPSVPARIVVAWDASPAAVRAVHGALPFMKRAETVTVVSVTDDKEFRPGQSAVELTHLLARHGAKAEFQPVQRGNGGVMPAILDVARNIQADMMVMGAVRHAPLHNLLFGSATMDLLDRGPAMATLLAA
ncbi:universal stress protein [Rubritepida flocculans]|uniref:universal stress protein n=1 Tax=Rubritepida flocculans TaxID=182403 RepID=UPI00048A388E|nr:universal stress protein [Rubritepida flocculans]